MQNQPGMQNTVPNSGSTAPAFQNSPTAAALASPNTPPNSVTGQPGAASVPMSAGNALQNQPNAGGSQIMSPNGSNGLQSPNTPPNSVTGRPGAQSVPAPGTNTLQTQPNNPSPFRAGTGTSAFGTRANGLPAAQQGTNNSNPSGAAMGGGFDVPPPASDETARQRVDDNRAARDNLRTYRQELRQDRQEDRQAARQDANDWRFARYNNEWWYWMPNNTWMYYRDNKWNNYDADSYRPSRYSTGYRGAENNNGTYYDEYGQQYRRDYTPLRSALRRAENNGNAPQVDVNAGGTRVEAGPNTGVRVDAR
jgi:hypothetical protein